MTTPGRWLGDGGIPEELARFVAGEWGPVDPAGRWGEAAIAWLAANPGRELPLAGDPAEVRQWVAELRASLRRRGHPHPGAPLEAVSEHVDELRRRVVVAQGDHRLAAGAAMAAAEEGRAAADAAMSAAGESDPGVSLDDCGADDLDALGMSGDVDTSPVPETRDTRPAPGRVEAGGGYG